MKPQDLYLHFSSRVHKSNLDGAQEPEHAPDFSPRVLDISEELSQKMKKLSKKDNSLYEQLIKKINEIINSYDVEHYKNLRYNLKDSKRVHIGHFVLVFQFDKTRNKINFDDFDHHDTIYKKG